MGAQRHLAHFLPDRVAFENPPVRFGMGDHRQAVVGEDAFRAGQRGQHGLRPAAETGEKMWFDEAGQDADIGYEIETVDAHRMPKRGLAEGNQVGVVMTIVLQAAIVLDNAVAEHGA